MPSIAIALDPEDAMAYESGGALVAYDRVSEFIIALKARTTGSTIAFRYLTSQQTSVINQTFVTSEGIGSAGDVSYKAAYTSQPGQLDTWAGLVDLVVHISANITHLTYNINNVTEDNIRFVYVMNPLDVVVVNDLSSFDKTILAFPLWDGSVYSINDRIMSAIRSVYFPHAQAADLIREASTFFSV